MGKPRLTHKDVHRAFRLVLSIVEAGSENVEDALLLQRLAAWLVARGWYTVTGGRGALEQWAAADPEAIRAEYAACEYDV